MAAKRSPKKNGSPRIGILIGSRTDLPFFKGATQILERFEVPYELQIGSAHRTPEVVGRYAKTALERGLEAIIVGAGGAAHLAGAVASHTTLPVLAVPLATSPLQGFDALLATVQMPAGIPVATLAIGKAGATNAAILAIEILALGDPRLRRELAKYRDSQKERIAGHNRNLRESNLDRG